MTLTIPAIRTAYALAATFGHGWATALRNAGPAAREAAIATAAAMQSVSFLNVPHEAQVARDQADGMTSWVGVLATPELAHITGSGSIAWRIHPDGSATISSGANVYAADGEWSRTLTGREVVAEITAAPGVFVAVPGEGRLAAMLRMAANAVQTGETQQGLYRVQAGRDDAPAAAAVHSDDVTVIRRSEHIPGDEE